MSLHFSDEEFARRRSALLAAMQAQKLEAMLLFAQESMYWLTGYDTFGFCFFQCLVVTADGEMVLLTRSADLRQAQNTSNIKDIRIWSDRQDADPTAELQDILDELNLLGAMVGVEYDTHGLTAANGRKLDQRMRAFARLGDHSMLVPELRLIKSQEEITYVRQAATQADQAFDAALALAAPGTNEADILAAMHQCAFQADGDYPANEFIIGSGHNALLCRYQSGRRTLDRQDQLTLEWAGVHRHYHAAMMQTVPIGGATARHKELHVAARTALEEIEAALGASRTTPTDLGDLFAIHARILDGAGLARHRLAACGYSLGARFAPSWMEPHMLYSGNERAVEPGMVLFAHMIIMDSDTNTAMCLGRTFLTTENGAEPLSRHGYDLLER
ncbi:MAG: Xaa-Pro peptidase family protein [Pseudomonadota bacterium]